VPSHRSAAVLALQGFVVSLLLHGAMLSSAGDR
jgi:hypothetical protein